MLPVFLDRFVDQLGDPQAGLDRIVIDEVQMRHGVELQAMRELAPQPAGRMLQSLHCLARTSHTGQMGEEDLRILQIGRDVDRGDRDHADARILDVNAQQLRELALDLIADALRARRVFFHGRLRSLIRRGGKPREQLYARRHKVRDTSTISYTSSWSPFWMSL